MRAVPGNLVYVRIITMEDEGQHNPTKIVVHLTVYRYPNCFRVDHERALSDQLRTGTLLLVKNSFHDVRYGLRILSSCTTLSSSHSESESLSRRGRGSAANSNAHLLQSLLAGVDCGRVIYHLYPLDRHCVTHFHFALE